jgi:hypothetical protein
MGFILLNKYFEYQINTISTTTSSISNKKSRSKARATLYGLSSLKRTGDVSVNMMSDHTTIRTKFNLGPLVLKVEKEFGRSTRKEVRSATATTAEMSGRLSLRVYHGGAATLHSIRVLQPKQVIFYFIFYFIIKPSFYYTIKYTEIKHKEVNIHF